MYLFFGCSSPHCRMGFSVAGIGATVACDAGAAHYSGFVADHMHVVALGLQWLQRMGCSCARRL